MPLMTVFYWRIEGLDTCFCDCDDCLDTIDSPDGWMNNVLLFDSMYIWDYDAYIDGRRMIDYLTISAVLRRVRTKIEY